MMIGFWTPAAADVDAILDAVCKQTVWTAREFVKVYFRVRRRSGQ
jgi:hypothetical protein